MTSISRATSSAKPLRSGIGRLVATTVLFVVFVAGVWLERARLLRGAADLWIVSDPVTRSDVVAVLGGQVDVRPFVAAKFYKEGLVTSILVSQVAESRSSKIGVTPGHTELNRMVLVNLGVPESAIGTFGRGNKSTFEEAVALREWADQHHVSRVIVPTEIFTARRVRWIFDREFAGSSVQVEVPSFEPAEYTRAEWWKTEAGMLTFQNEILKYIYYRFKY